MVSVSAAAEQSTGRIRVASAHQIGQIAALIHLTSVRWMAADRGSGRCR